MSEIKISGNIRSKVLFKEPSRYNVIMHNDDFTTMEFVVYVLMRIFHKDESTANSIMLKIHNEGKAIVGNYSLDIAMAKTQKTIDLARSNGFPLIVTYEPNNSND